MAKNRSGLQGIHQIFAGVTLRATQQKMFALAGRVILGADSVFQHAINFNAGVFSQREALTLETPQMSF